MIGLDTNILVRYLVRDDKRHADAASALIRKISDDGERCFISLLVLCELVWVLESAYEYRKEDIASVLEKMLSTRQFEIESKDIARQAIDDYREGRGDIADYLIGRIHTAHGCDKTVTFDRSLKHSPLFSMLG